MTYFVVNLYTYVIYCSIVLSEVYQAIYIDYYLIDFIINILSFQAPGYHQKIKKPMDFGTIRSNLNYMKYKNNQEFVHDLYLVLHNCWLFNPKSSPEFKAADVLQKEIKVLLKEYEITNTSPFNGHYSPIANDL